MYRPQGARSHPHHGPDMYDDKESVYASEDRYERSSPAHDRHDSRQDLSRPPNRGQGDRINTFSKPGRDYTQQYSNSDSRYHDHQDQQSRSPPRRQGRGRYNDRDREGYRSPIHDRSRSRSRSPYYGAPPNRTVIIEGLALSMTQEDILNELQSNLKLDGLEEVRLIKDKKTGLSRQFAFAQFSKVDHAKAFLDSYYPSFQMFGAYDPSQSRDSEGVKVRVAYSREKEDRDRAGQNEDDWKCEICYLVNYSHRLLCFRCNSPRTRASATGLVGIVTQANMASNPGFATSGDSDVSPDSTPSQFLLFRGLEPGVTEELLAKAVTKLYKGNQLHPESQPAKKTKITSTSSDANFGAKEGTLRRVLLVRDRITNESWRYGFAEFGSVEDAQAAVAKYNSSEKFTISSKPVIVSYIHAGVFVPVIQAPAAEFERFTFSPLHNKAIKLMYWDESGYVSELGIAVEDDRSALAKAKERIHAKLAAAAGKEGLIAPGKEGEAKAKKRKAEKDALSSSKKVVAPHLQFWSNRHAELHGLPSKENDDLADSPSPSGKPVQIDIADINNPSSQSFADMTRKCCLLCSRQFKTEAEVNKHERVSKLHRDNMLNEELKSKALAKLSKLSAQEGDVDSSSYRDRAKERRQAFNQPKQPAAQHNKVGKDSKSIASPPKEIDIVPAPSKGAALLGKMGWTAGEGLGAQGTGRKDAITTELYVQGVGLGAQGGKMGDAIEEANRSTRSSYADFVNTAKDKAKERFDRMA